MKVQFKENNSIRYSQDFGFYCGVPHDIIFEISALEVHSGNILKLIGPNYGGKPYGNGAIYINKKYFNEAIIVDSQEADEAIAADSEDADYDSTKESFIKETIQHKLDVASKMGLFASILVRRASQHDNSKLEEPECTIFSKFIEKVPFGTSEYDTYQAKMKESVEHHYIHNTHHPEHYRDGIKGMNLIDLIEMLCDWSAATSRHENDNIIKSLEHNQKRFSYSDELAAILYNTLSLIDAV